MLFKASTENGKLFIDEKDKLTSYLQRISGKKIFVNIEHTSGKKRSVEQNSLYYGILRKIMAVLLERGFDDLNVITLSHYFKRKFLADVIIDPATSEEIEIVKSTTELKTKEFSNYIESVTRFAIQDMDIADEIFNPYLSSEDIII